MPASLDIELLRTFHSIVRFGQFLAASTYLCRSPSTVSMHIRRLEQLLGGRLFERDNQAVVLTPAGRRFCEQTASYLQMHDQLIASFRNETSWAGTVRLGVSEEYGAPLLQGLLPVLAAEYPQIELEVETGYSGYLADHLAKGRLDLALLIEQTEEPDAADPRSIILDVVQPVWAASHNHLLDLNRGAPLALHGEGCPFRRDAIDALTKQGLAWRAVVISAAPSVVRTAVKTGLAVGVVDRTQVDGDMRIIGHKEGLPALPVYSLRLALSPQEETDACSVVARLMTESFRR
jgi:DNA-binding transcriptional LysR family regulator